ncbi:NO-inducible flavohemoprotein [Aurantimonas sp. 22II-16-19i]|uniref:NO-inducible flavohemoprotein n=1 Tax=Aurantimonas sp. 22II-16-19i TaxID=1317114 RepID=UPI0009F7FC49|nr:NO-inducible flavohemoprotein [Aurantimonas sp. 22II-16-19i]ORE90729.1 oxidoreductase FAD/NAD(P)-binding subunit [Aurantimonas sp. 22II-16-19i]
MPSQLSEQTIATVKATVPALETHGLEITTAMYARMFQNPMVRDLFNQSHHGDSGSQPRALAGAVLAYAQNIDNLGVLGAAVERIAQKHVGLQILPEHYPYVAEALLGAIGDVLGDAANEEVLVAWGEAYWFLADILIAREAAVYQALAASDGGWSGWRDFRIEAKIPESDVITSFVLRPVDGGRVVAHRPGQYLTFWLDLPGRHPQKRNYSISAAPNVETYRISVKREAEGAASNWLHDHAQVGTVVKVSPPAGEFYLAEQPTRPVVLVSGGVGLTPMISMLETLASKGTEVPVHYVHGALNGASHAMRDRVRELATSTASVDATTFYLEPRPEDVKGRDFDEEGLISVDWLKAHTPVADADYYLCGPKGFLRTFVNGLALAGVAQDRIHYEFFGPADELLAA